MRSSSSASRLLPLVGLLAHRSRLASATTIWLAGDSTMAPGGDGAGTGTQGWGEYLQYSFDVSEYTVSNQAIAGRSARSYTREGRFDWIAGNLTAGDWVVVEFGHNDGGSLDDDDGRTDCPGQGDETCQTVYDGVNETVYTFPWYLEDATAKFLDAGAAGVILSSQTPDNVWETGVYTWVPNRFQYYTWLATSVLGGPSAGVYYVAHGDYAAQVEDNMGNATVNADYPLDHTHTAPALADKIAGSFVLGLKCGTSPLGSAAINSTSDLEATVLGDCITYNSTVTALE